MTAVRGLLLIVILSVLAMAGAILANWIPRPATMRTRWVLAGLAGVVLVSAVLGLLADGRQPALGRRPLPDWVSGVNKSCAVARPRADAARERNDAAQSRQETVSALQDLEAAHSDLHKKVSGLELPSDPNDRDKAKDWLDVYGVRLDRLATFVDLMQEAEVPPETAITQAAQLYAEATTTAKRKDEALGISCP
ncbi:hypothetical protein U2F26_16990 [Micromonospora sp. 4G57]|uniref:Uncharacterized protein n=1 Tax=Micromonospora sicca TaxID=2202420 RepID=A0ABU5JB97_9ACTN|nr:MULTISPECIES: hypothetical protein [unclassified Micromonospora]MDZ5444417.1 hypothetical protein [Micromonospora sp. 4G57]MDZ5489749.1 hypothetical protein [Micromonospora sp. 4G53]